uniref:Uncharacterized protein n=2 Tax=Schizaphis graminum TaxID=13262 RepID=A0A2S2NGK5_SCHGA
MGTHTHTHTQFRDNVLKGGGDGFARFGCNVVRQVRDDDDHLTPRRWAFSSDARRETHYAAVTTTATTTVTTTAAAMTAKRKGGRPVEHYRRGGPCGGLPGNCAAEARAFF